MHSDTFQFWHFPVSLQQARLRNLSAIYKSLINQQLAQTGGPQEKKKKLANSDLGTDHFFPRSFAFLPACLPACLFASASFAFFLAMSIFYISFISFSSLLLKKSRVVSSQDGLNYISITEEDFCQFLFIFSLFPISSFLWWRGESFWIKERKRRRRRDLFNPLMPDQLAKLLLGAKVSSKSVLALSGSLPSRFFFSFFRIIVSFFSCSGLGCN